MTSCRMRFFLLFLFLSLVLFLSFFFFLGKPSSRSPKHSIVCLVPPPPPSSLFVVAIKETDSFENCRFPPLIGWKERALSTLHYFLFDIFLSHERF